MSAGESLESALAELESRADALSKRAVSVVSGIKALKTAAQIGNFRELRKIIAQVQSSSAGLGDAALETLSSWSFDEESYFSSDQLLSELVTEAQRVGLNAFIRDDRLYSYPVVARVVARDKALLVGRVRARGVRPSYVVGHLRALQKRPLQFRPAQFLNTLFRRYCQLIGLRGRTVGEGTVVSLAEIYTELTPLPGQEKEYSVQEFARDIYVLDQSGERQTKDGAYELNLPASTGTKTSKVLTVITQDGEECTYYGISFTRTGA